jgi:hypothetical protein
MVETLQSFENPMECNEIWPIMECDKEMDTTTPGDNNNNYKNNKFELASPKNILMSPLNLSFL